ncbi:hypothetical protein [Streptomyces sp. WAC 06783]|uniref:hypothetical protein n=1 Tax=Streptomyces sp. WAC 06783 TaxID=2203211 RepID=UPI0026B9706A
MRLLVLYEPKVWGDDDVQETALVIRTVVVDDEALVRCGFRLVLHAAEDIEVVAAVTGGKALAVDREDEPGVVPPRLDELLFSSLENVLVESVKATDMVVRIEALSTARRAACSDRGRLSGRIHGSCLRFPQELPTADKSVVMALRARRFLCAEASCPRRTFA